MTFLITLFVTFSAKAEYRAYEYVISNQVNDSADLKTQTIKSSLNPRAYLAYHGGRDSITLTLRRTWMCPGNTAYKPICPSPYEILTQPTNELNPKGAQ